MRGFGRGWFVRVSRWSRCAYDRDGSEGACLSCTHLSPGGISLKGLRPSEERTVVQKSPWLRRNHGVVCCVAALSRVVARIHTFVYVLRTYPRSLLRPPPHVRKLMMFFSQDKAWPLGYNRTVTEHTSATHRQGGCRLPRVDATASCCGKDMP